MTQLSRSAPHIGELWQTFCRSRDEGVRALLVGHYLPLAKIIAAKMYGRRTDDTASFDDYLQYARVGLLESVDRFDPGRTVSFESYSTYRIRGAILNGLGHESEAAAQRSFWRTRMPDRMQSLVAQVNANPERASLEELVSLTVGVTLSLILDEDEAPVDETPQSNPYVATETAQFCRLVKSLVEELPPRERDIIRQHYFERREFQSLAEEYGITKGRISQLHAKALSRLRTMLGERPTLDRRL